MFFSLALFFRYAFVNILVSVQDLPYYMLCYICFFLCARESRIAALPQLPYEDQSNIFHDGALSMRQVYPHSHLNYSYFHCNSCHIIPVGTVATRRVLTL